MQRSDCTHTKCYCEENVYCLIPRLLQRYRQPRQPAADCAASSSRSERIAGDLLGGSGGAACSGLDESQLWVVFISNPGKQVPLWRQSAGDVSRQGLVVWDYHVILIQYPAQPAVQQGGAAGQHQDGSTNDRTTVECGGQQRSSLETDRSSEAAQLTAAAAAGHGGCTAVALVWDLDTTLPFPCSLGQYASQALRCGQLQLAEQFQRRYRVIAARLYLSHFASDRSHMRRPGGGWLAPSPVYPCIVARSDGCTNNIHRYWDMEFGGPRGPEPASSARVDTEDRAAATAAARAPASPHGHPLHSQAPEPPLPRRRPLPPESGARGLDCLDFGSVLDEQEFLRRFSCSPLDLGSSGFGEAEASDAMGSGSEAVGSEDSSDPSV